MNGWGVLVRGTMAVGCVCVLLIPPAHAEDALTEREARLLSVIERLESRVDELEDKVRALEHGEPARTFIEPDERLALEARIQTLEEQIPPLRSPNALEVYWDDTLRMRTADNRINLRMNARFQTDFAFFNQPYDLQVLWNPVLREAFYDTTDDGVEIRHAWLGIAGSAYENLSFQIQWNFVKGRVTALDTHLTFHNIPYIGNIKLGRFQEPFSLDEMTFIPDVMFMERALPNVFAPSYNTGVELYNTILDDRVNWQLALTYDTDGTGDSIRSGRAVTGRIVGRPIQSEDGRRLLHLGAAYSVRSPNDTIRLRSRPEANLAPFFVDTGQLYADNIHLRGLEAAAVYGPLSVQAEHITSKIDTRFGGTRTFDGWYAQASYFLTGESRPYSNLFGTFVGVKPRNNFNIWKDGHSRGLGAWELAARYSELDLNDGFIRGGRQKNWTAGVNWYLNPITRISLNYIRADIDHDLYWGDFEALQMRVQVRF